MATPVKRIDTRRRQRMPERFAEHLGRLLLAFANLHAIDHLVMLISHAIYTDGPKGKCIEAHCRLHGFGSGATPPCMRVQRTRGQQTDYRFEATASRTCRLRPPATPGRTLNAWRHKAISLRRKWSRKCICGHTHKGDRAPPISSRRQSVTSCSTCFSACRNDEDHQ